MHCTTRTSRARLSGTDPQYSLVSILRTSSNLGTNSHSAAGHTLWPAMPCAGSVLITSNHNNLTMLPSAPPAALVHWSQYHLYQSQNCLFSRLQQIFRRTASLSHCSSACTTSAASVHARVVHTVHWAVSPAAGQLANWPAGLLSTSSQASASYAGHPPRQPCMHALLFGMHKEGGVVCGSREGRRDAAACAPVTGTQACCASQQLHCLHTLSCCSLHCMFKVQQPCQACMLISSRGDVVASGLIQTML